MPRASDEAGNGAPQAPQVPGAPGETMGVAAEPLLEIRDLVTSFQTERGLVRAVDGVSLRIPRRTTIGLVGESGSGKSVTALSILRLLPTPPARIERGQILFEGRDLLGMTERQLRAVRGNRISMVFQEPMTSLNPVFTVGAQISEAVLLHQKVSRRQARERAIEMLKTVGIPSPESRVDSYPHELSGGMRQRVMIAMALSCEPSLLLADEPTTALDVTIQAQVLDLLRALQARMGMSMLLITHDLGVVAETAELLIVMYAGQVVETGPVKEVFAHPRHPYTEGLLRSLPSFGGARPRRLPTIEGVVPDLLDLPTGCRFVTRCPRAEATCRDVPPALKSLSGERASRCHFAEEI